MRRLTVLIASLVALASMLVPAQSGASPTVGENRRVNQDNDLTRFHFNSSVMVDPTSPSTIVVTDSAAPEPNPAVPRTCRLHRSIDGGATWTSRELPLPASYEACFAGNGRFDEDGTLYFTGWISTRPTPAAAPDTLFPSIAVWRSDDGGHTLAPPVIAAERVESPLAPASDVGREPHFLGYIMPDPLAEDRVLLSYTACRRARIFVCQPVFSQSTDRGLTWSAPVPMGSAHYMTAAGLVYATLDVGPAGEIYSVFFDAKTVASTNGALYLAKSTDGGASFRTSLIEPAIFSPLRPKIAVDRTRPGHIYVAWHDSRESDTGRLAENLVRAYATGGSRRNVVFRRSIDGGRTWEPARLLNTDEPGARRDHFLPIIGLSPDGRLDVWWYDSRFSPVTDPANANYNRYYDVVYTSSSDGGSTFAPEVRVTDVSIDSRVGPGGFAQLFFHHLWSRPEAAYLAWTDTRNGGEDTGINDTYFAIVDQA